MLLLCVLCVVWCAQVVALFNSSAPTCNHRADLVWMLGPAHAESCGTGGIIIDGNYAVNFVVNPTQPDPNPPSPPHDQLSRDGDSHTGMYIGIGVGAAVALMAAAGVFYYFKVHKPKQDAMQDPLIAY